MKANHRHESCRDDDCELPYCRIWKEARAEGYDDGYRDGFAAGLQAGSETGSKS